MNLIKKGDIVGRKSYNSDVLFKVKDIIKIDNRKIALLTGLIERVTADSPIEDLKIIDKDTIKQNLRKLDKKIEERIISRELSPYKINILTKNNRTQGKILTGKILHLDGDKKYSQKSNYYYKKLGLNAIVRNIPEYKQSKVVYSLLKIHQPDILVITGHDGMIKRGVDYHDLYNYRNSRHFINTVKEARRYDAETKKNLVIFAGACQSYFEAIISAGANFASSPARILIDFMDPLIVAEKVATTESTKYITMDDIAYELRDGKRGIDGIGASGKLVKRLITCLSFCLKQNSYTIVTQM